ncbi:MAG: N-acetylmuramoyl-L-alanine amidase [Endomicrobium sp.]|jgi:N-acetylmuramoyl-L-alanine amidase|nr:N-acetylmuramoyl-L-alanine amidase [Endomicrobium sp.]
MRRFFTAVTVTVFLLIIFAPDFSFSEPENELFKNLDKVKLHPPGDRSVLKDKIICIDPGHQKVGNKEQEPISPNSQNTKPKVAPGAKGVVSGTPEYVITLNIAEKLKGLLKDKKAVVVMTRKTHDVNISNVERALVGNMIGGEIMVRIHADSSLDSLKRGVSVLIPSKKSIKTPILAAKSRKAGEIILEKVLEITNADDLGIVERDDLSGFNWSEIPVVLVETGFLSNPEDDKLLNSSSYQYKLAKGIYNGLIEYFRN